MSIRMADLEKHNDELIYLQKEDKNALLQLDNQYQRAMEEIRLLKSQLAEERLQTDKARHAESLATKDADTAIREA